MRRLKAPNEAEATFLFQIKALKLPEPEREYRFDPIRKWRFDFALPAYLIAVEIEGGAFTGGRHVRGYGFREDCVKYNSALMQGWRVIRVTSDQVKTGMAVHWYETLILTTRHGMKTPPCLITTHLGGDEKPVSPTRAFFEQLKLGQISPEDLPQRLEQLASEPGLPDSVLEKIQALLSSKLHTHQSK